MTASTTNSAKKTVSQAAMEKADKSLTAAAARNAVMRMRVKEKDSKQWRAADR